MKKLFLLISLFICTIVLAGCNLNNSGNNVTTSEVRTTVIKAEEVVAIEDEELKKEIQYEAKDETTVEEYLSKGNETPEIKAENLVVDVTKELAKVNFKATKIEATVNTGTPDTEVIYLWMDGQCVYLGAYAEEYDSLTEETITYPEVIKIDFARVLTELLTQENIDFFSSMISSSASSFVPTPSVEIPEIEFSMDYFDEDAEKANLYHLNIEKFLIGAFGNIEGQQYYSLYTAYASQLFTEKPDFYFTFINGKFRTVGMNVQAKATNFPIDQTTFLSGTLSIKAEAKFHYNESELTKAEGSLNISADITSTGNQYIKGEINQELVVDLENVNVSLKGNVNADVSFGGFTLKANVSDELSIGKSGLKVAVKGVADGGSSFYFDVDANINIAVSESYQLSGSGKVQLSMDKKVEKVEVFSLTITNDVTVDADILNEKENVIDVVDEFLEIIEDYQKEFESSYSW